MSMNEQDKTTRIEALDTVVAWNADTNSHVYLRHADVVMRGREIVQVGGSTRRSTAAA